MATDVSKAQLDVWEWKEKAYEQIKNLPPGERTRFIHEQTRQLSEEIRKRKAAKRLET
jgi:hypothetical protein